MRHQMTFSLTLPCVLISVLAISLLTGCNHSTEPNPSMATHRGTAESNKATQIHKPQAPMPETFYHADSATLQKYFQSPPAAVKPWVYWYWVNDHISKTGIEQDLAAMQKAGISTALIGIIHLQPSIGGYGKVTAMTDEWWDHLRFAIEKAPEYNIDIGLFNSPGWSQSGGPWVELNQSMRYLDHTEYQVDDSSRSAPLVLNKPEGYAQDVKVIAFKTPSQEKIRLNSAHTTAKVSYLDVKNKKTQEIIDQDANSILYFPKALFANKDTKFQIDFSHNQTFTARTLEIYPHDTFAANASLLAKNAQGEYVEIKSFDVQRPRDMAAIGPDHNSPIVINFTKTTAKEFRLVFSDFDLAHGGNNQTPGIKEINLTSGYKLARFVEKKLAKVHPTPQPKHDSYLWPAPIEADDRQLVIDAAEVVDVSEFLQGNELHWQAPAGDWTLIHYFMRTTGTTNGPSSKNARGPEIDKLSKEIAQQHFDAYVGKIINSLQPQKPSALKYLVVDSYEQGAQNWTDGFAQKFAEQYGYDPIPYLPVYTGRIVNSAEQSERFLWDVRRMVADGVAYEYTAGLRERAHQHGLKLWLENYGHWGFPGEFLQYGGQADIVSGEFWASGNLGAIELKAASAAAHLYGHKTVMSESFTAGRGDAFTNHPWNFKKRGDWSFVEGINHTLLHVYIHQAYSDKFPGVSAWFGSEFNRNNTWFGYMGSWLDYIKRCNYLLQQGNYVADLMYFIGEDAPKMTGEISPQVPAGYAYDFINAEVIINSLRVEQGKFVLPSGMQFSLLVLPNLETMRPAVLTKIKQLVAAGGAIYGPPPSRSPSLQNYPAADREVQRLAAELWQASELGQESELEQKPGDPHLTHVRYGKGHVFYSASKNYDLAKVMQIIAQPADLINLPESVIWTHRSSDTHEIYFIANQSDKPVSVTPSFRGSDKLAQPQHWDPVSGKTHQIALYHQEHKRINVPFHLAALESRFIIFEKSPSADNATNNSLVGITHQGKNIWLPNAIENDDLLIDVIENGSYQITLANGKIHAFRLNDLPAAQTLSSPWQLTFEQGRDLPTQLELKNLTSLTELQPLALKHYSGEIGYQTSFPVSASMLANGQRWLLNLGEVGVIARVKVNGKNFGEVWSRPLQLDITDALHIGNNALEVEVATTWLNRLIGDLKYPEQFPDTNQPKRFTTATTFENQITQENQLQPSGLIGPVTISPLRRIAIDLTH